MEENKTGRKRKIIRFFLRGKPKDIERFKKLREKVAPKDVGRFFNKIFTVGISCIAQKLTDMEVADGIAELQDGRVPKKLAPIFAKYLITYLKTHG